MTYISTRSIPAAIKYYIELSVIKVKRPTDFIHIIEHAFGKEYITSREYKHFLLAWEYIENDLKLYNDFLEKIGEIPMRCDSMEEKVAALNYHKFNR